jgi:hypothetical protein
MNRVRTATGKTIDMAALSKANDEVRAVSNVSINARGDRIDRSGNVVATVQSVARKQHENAQPAQKRKLSQATLSTGQQADPLPASNEAADSTTKVKSRNTKVRDDGTTYVEVEYEDGSMSVEEETK